MLQTNWKQFPNFQNLEISDSALYLLAAPSTPESAREEAIERAENGMTLEAIAKADGTVSKSTIHEALQSEPVFQNRKTEIPTKVTGKDGKAYPTKKPRKAKADGTVCRKTVERAINDVGQMTNVPTTITDTKGPGALQHPRARL